MGDAYDSRWKPTKFITLPRYKQPLWLGNESAITDTWFSSKEEINIWRNIPCILEVDLVVVYPENLHHHHNDYPLAPENTMVGKVDKLVPNLRKKKKKYAIHYKNLKLYECLALKITKIHIGIKFKEKTCLKMFINLNTKLRTQAQNDFAKDFFKLMNNSVFCKT